MSSIGTGETAVAAEAEKRVGWTELFFDLVFVFAITELAALLHADHTWSGVGRALIVFVPIYWAWVGMSVHANTRDIENTVDRLGIFAVGLGSLFMALAVPEAFTDRAVLFASSYLALRIVLLGLVLRTRRFFLNPFTVAALVSGPLRLVGAFLPTAWLITLWAVAAVVDIATPAVARRLVVRQVHFTPAHLPERFGLFVIIALGESIVSIGVPAASTDHLDAATLLAVAVSFALVCGLWWVYFIAAHEMMAHAFGGQRPQADVVREVLSYGHFALIGAIVAVSGGLAEVLAHPAGHLGLPVAGLLYGGAALYLATLGVIRRRVTGRWSRWRLVATATALVLIPVVPLAPALVALTGLLTITVAVTLVGHAPSRTSTSAN